MKAKTVSDEFKNMSLAARRRFLLNAAKSLLGVSVVPLAHSLVQAAPAKAGGKAKSVIYLFMDGAMSHLDTFDPKPGAKSQGETKAIKTRINGVQLSEHLPQLAKRLDQMSLVRSMNTETAAHRPGRYLMRTGYKEIATTRHPNLGAWIEKLDGRGNANLPGSVVIGGASQHPGAGFLDARFSPVPIANPVAGLQNTSPPSYLADNQFEHRMSLTSQFDRDFRRKYPNRSVQSYSQLYSEAVKLLQSKDLSAFDISKEAEKSKAAYGDNPLGQGCLLARRLVEHKIRFVEVAARGWDHHRDLFQDLPARAQQLDQAMSALLDDLKSKGLLDETLVVLTSEFGRSPRINQNAGRDHHPGAFTSVFAGGGIKGGGVWGASDEEGYTVEEDHVSVQDFNATIGHALGLSLQEEVYSPDGRPFTLAHGGSPLIGLFS